MKKAFTLSEALVTLAIIGVLAAILIPVVDKAKPDKDKITYKKALYSLQSAMSNAMDELDTKTVNTASYWADVWSTDNAGSFCDFVAKSLNTSGAIHCESTYHSDYYNPNFITTDGIRYWGLEGTGHFENLRRQADTPQGGKNTLYRVDDADAKAKGITADSYYRIIYVDRMMSASDLKKFQKLRNSYYPGGGYNIGDGIKIRVKYDGRIDTPDANTYRYENELIENAFEVKRKS